jgi:DNA invertase Pin-like site-specific DNA recombinase
MNRVALYVRVSTEEQAREGYSIEAQEQACRDEAVRAGATSITLFRDEGWSGTSVTRPALQDLLARLAEFDAVYVWRLDRLSRSARDWTSILHEMQQQDCGFHSICERVDATTAMGKAMLGVMAVFSEMFIDILRENISIAHEARAAKGLYMGHPPIGYSLAEKGSHQPPPVDPKGAAFVKELFDRCVAGDPIIQLTHWAQTVIAPARAQKWSCVAIRGILANPFYIGKMKFRGQYMDGIHEPIVGYQVFSQVQEVLRLQKPVHPQSRNYTLASILRCGVCGGIMRSFTNKAGGAYSCYQSYTDAQAVRTHTLYTMRRKTDAALWEVTRAVLARVTIEMPAGDDHTEPLLERIAQLEQSLGYNVQAARAAGLPVETFARENDALASELKVLRAQVEQVRADRESDVAQAGIVRSGAPAEPTTNAQRLALMRLLFDRVEVRRGDGGLVVLRFVPREHAQDVFECTLPKRWSAGSGEPVLIGM